MVIMRFVLLTFFLSTSPALLFCQPQTQASDIRTQLAGIKYRQSNDLNDYVSRCRKVQALLPTLDSFYRQSGITLERLRIEYRDNPHLLQMAEFYAAMNQLDRAGLVLLRREMVLAAKMSALPSGVQRAFFDKEIIPIQNQEDSLSKREIQTALNAKRSGIPLPPDVDRSVSTTR